MPRDTKEPQSYGSDRDWLTGRTGQEVNEQASAPAPEHRAFYDERRESEHSGEAQGGLTSPVQRAEPIGQASEDDAPVPRVTSTPAGAKRDSFFKKRDYE